MYLIIAIICSFLLMSCGNNDFNNLGSVSSVGVGKPTNLKWADSMIPVKLRFPKSLESKIYDSVYYAVEEWNIKADRPLIYIEFAEIPADQFNGSFDNTNSFYSLIDWNETEYDHNVLAITRYKYFRNQLIEADIVLNESKNIHYRDASDQIGGNEYDLQSILLHEIGHFLGFGHQNESDSIMATTLLSGAKTRTLSYRDVVRLKEKY